MRNCRSIDEMCYNNLDSVECISTSFMATELDEARVRAPVSEERPWASGLTFEFMEGT